VFTNKGISYVSLNIVTLPGHLDEFQYFMCNNPVDIIALNETRLESYIPDNEINIDGYDLYRNDRNREGGGVAIYISNKSGFTNKVRDDLMPPELEIITIEVASPKSRPIVVIAWYRPQSEIKLFDHIESILEKLECENKDVVLMGDVNCDVLATNPSCYTNRLNAISDNFHLKQVITEPTRVTEDIVVRLLIIYMFHVLTRFQSVVSCIQALVIIHMFM
jgi:exonuclease III